MATSGASISEVYDQLNGADQTHPGTVKAFADFAMEAGDMITVRRDGRDYKVNASTATHIWRGQSQVTINSGGNEKRDAIEKVSRQKYAKSGAGMRNNQALYHDIWSEDGHLHSVIRQTESTITLYVNNTYDRMKAGLDLTSSSASLYATNLYTQMKSGLELTSSSAALYVQDVYTQMKSGLELTSSSAALYVQDVYTQMKSGLDLTSSSAALYVQDAYTRMTAGLDVTSSSAALYARNRTTRAFIVARINANGEGEALIGADKVSISGTTTINDVMTIQDNKVLIKKPTYMASGSSMQAAKFEVATGGDVEFMGSGGDILLKYEHIDTMIIKAEVSGNTLRLWKRGDNTSGDPSITFSKAASTISGSWSGGVVTVSADPNGEATYVRSFSRGTVAWDNDKKHATVYANVIRTSGQSQYVDVADAISLYVDTTEAWTKGWGDSYDEVGLNYSTTQTLNPGDSRTIRAMAKPTPTGELTGVASVTVNARELRLRTPAAAVTPTTSDQTILPGSDSGGTAYDGLAQVVVKGDARLLEGNIKSGVTIFGVTGTYSGSGATPVLSGDWSGGVFTVTSDPAPVADKTTTLRALTPDGNVSKSGTSVSRTFKVQHGVDEDHLLDTGFSATVTISAAEVYNDGWGDSRDVVKLNYSSDQTIDPGGSRTIHAMAKATPSSEFASVASVTVSANTANVSAGNWTAKGISDSGRASRVYNPSAGNGSSYTQYLALGVYNYNSSGYAEIAINGYDTATGGTRTAALTRISQMVAGGWSGNSNVVTLKFGLTGNMVSTSTLTIDGSARYNAGWGAARNKCSVPSSTSTSGSMTVTIPPATVDGAAVPYTYTPSADNTYAYIMQGTTKVAQVSHNAYSNGGNAAGVTASWSGNVFTVTRSLNTDDKSKTCTVTAGLSDYTYDSSAHTYSIKGYAYGNSSKKAETSAKSTGTEAYNAGWGAARNKCSVPSSTSTDSSMTVKIPPATVDGTAAEYPYSPAVDNSYAYIKQGSTTVARISHTVYSDGVATGRGQVKYIMPYTGDAYHTGDNYQFNAYSASGGDWYGTVAHSSTTGVQIKLSDNRTNDDKSADPTEIPAGGITANGVYKYMQNSGYIGIRYLSVHVQNPHPTQYNMKCTSKSQTYPGSTIYNYTFTLEGAQNVFSVNTSYNFWR